MMSHNSLQGSGLRCELVTDFARLQSLASEWDRLFEMAPDGGIFQSWAWARAFWKAHGEEFSLCTPVVFEKDRAVGILPVAVRAKRAQLLGTPYADYNGLLCEPGYDAAVWSTALSTLLDAALDWGECVFDNLPESSPAVRRPDLLPVELRRHTQVVFRFTAAAAVKDSDGFFDHLSRKQSLRYNENKLARRGKLCFRHIEDRQEILAHLETFFAFHASRHGINGVCGQFVAAPARQMLKCLVTELDPARELRFSILELNGRPLAYHLGFQHAGKFISYQPVFDLDHWDDSPGEVLLRNLFKYAHEHDLNEFDFTIGDEAYKSRFANQVRQTFTLHLERNPLLPRVQVRRAVRAVRDRVRRDPATIRYGRRVAAALRQVTYGLRHPPAIARAASRALERIFCVTEILICHTTGVPIASADAEVRRAGLKDLGLLRLQQDVAISDETVRCCRERLKRGDSLHLVSRGASQYLFWTGNDISALELPDVSLGTPGAVVSEGPVLLNATKLDFGTALAALLSAKEFSGDVWIALRRRAEIDSILQRCGYTLRNRIRCFSVLGRARTAHLASAGSRERRGPSALRVPSR